MTVGSWLQLHPPTCSRPILPPVARSRAPRNPARAFGPLPPSPPPDYTAAVNQYSHEAARHRQHLLSRCLPFAHLPESPAHTLRRLRGLAAPHSCGALHNLGRFIYLFILFFFRLEVMKVIFHCLMRRNRLKMLFRQTERERKSSPKIIKRPPAGSTSLFLSNTMGGCQ